LSEVVFRKEEYANSHYLAVYGDGLGHMDSA
jgi:hypothetical protein